MLSKQENATIVDPNPLKYGIAIQIPVIKRAQSRIFDFKIAIPTQKTFAIDPLAHVSSDSYYDDGGYDDMGGEVIGGAGNAADLTEGGEETLPEETENGEAPAADAEEPAEGIDPAEAGAVVVD